LAVLDAIARLYNRVYPPLNNRGFCRRTGGYLKNDFWVIFNPNQILFNKPIFVFDKPIEQYNSSGYKKYPQDGSNQNYGVINQ
jgi:hypothetical protein